MATINNNFRYRKNRMITKRTISAPIAELDEVVSGHSKARSYTGKNGTFKQISSTRVLSEKVTTELVTTQVNSYVPSAAPEAPTDGTTYFNENDKRLKIFTGGVWRNIALD